MNESDVEMFDLLFDKRLTEDQFLSLKVMLYTDAVFKRKFIIYKGLRREIEFEENSTHLLKPRFGKLDKKNRHKKRTLLLMSIAVATSLLVIIGHNLFFTKENHCLQIYRMFKDSESGLPIMMNRENTIENYMIFIAQKDYGHALDLLNKDKENDTILYYKGFCLEMMDKDKEALLIYKELTQSQSRFISDKSKFRYALMCLKRNDTTAVKLLKDIAFDMQHPYKETAKKMLESFAN